MKIISISADVLMILALCYGVTVLNNMHSLAISRFDRIEFQILQASTDAHQRTEELAVRAVRLEVAHQNLLQRIERIEGKLRNQSLSFE